MCTVKHPLYPLDFPELEVLRPIYFVHCFQLLRLLLLHDFCPILSLLKSLHFLTTHKWDLYPNLIPKFLLIISFTNQIHFFYYSIRDKNSLTQCNSSFVNMNFSRFQTYHFSSFYTSTFPYN